MFNLAKIGLSTKLFTQSQRFFYAANSKINNTLSVAPASTGSVAATPQQGRHVLRQNFSMTTETTTMGCPSHALLMPKNINLFSHQPTRLFHAAKSKINYLDFRHRFKTQHLRLHLLIIRRQKMKKHRLRKFRRKFKCLLGKQRLKREIAKEKAFRVELLSIIREAEQFDPKEYALAKIAEINNKPVEPSREERLEKLKELIRKNRHQVEYIKPKHKRADIWAQ